MSGDTNTCTIIAVFEQVRNALSTAIDELAVPVDAGALADCVGLLDRLMAKVLDGVAAFDEAEGWRPAGALNMTGWLRTAGCSRAQAHNLARTAKRLAGLPVTAAAYRDGVLSTGQVQAIVANLSDPVSPLFAVAEAGLVPTLAAMPVGDVAATMQAWAQAAHDSLTDPGDAEPAVRRRLYLSRTLDGRRELSGSLDPEAGLLAEAALRIARTDDLEGEPERSPAQCRADGLVDIFRFYVDHQQSTPPGTRHRPHLNVFFDHDDLLAAAGERAGGGAGVGPLAWAPDGTTLDAAAVLRLACDAGVNRVLTKGRSTILDYGTTTRVVPAHLFQALVARDRHCRFGDCDVAADRCDAHHVRHWAHGGPTEIGNLVLACWGHHHRLHEPGWHAKLLPDATLTVTTPTGQTIKGRPAANPPTSSPPNHPAFTGDATDAPGWSAPGRRRHVLGPAPDQPPPPPQPRAGGVARGPRPRPGPSPWRRPPPLPWPGRRPVASGVGRRRPLGGGVDIAGWRAGTSSGRTSTSAPPWCSAVAGATSTPSRWCPVDRGARRSWSTASSALVASSFIASAGLGGR